MPRCTDCNKFATLDCDTEPELESQDLTFDSGTADWDIQVRIVNNCADCGTELTETTFNLDGSFEDIDLDDYDEDEYNQWELKVEGLDRTERGGIGRFDKKYYGFSGSVVLYDSNGKQLASEDVKDDIQASAMEEL